MEIVLIGVYIIFFFITGVIGQWFAYEEIPNPDIKAYLAIAAIAIIWPISLAAIITGFMPIIWFERQQKKGIEILYKWGDYAKIGQMTDPQMMRDSLVTSIKKLSTKDLNALSRYHDMGFKNQDPYKVAMIVFDELVERGIMEDS